MTVSNQFANAHLQQNDGSMGIYLTPNFVKSSKYDASIDRTVTLENWPLAGVEAEEFGVNIETLTAQTSFERKERERLQSKLRNGNTATLN